LITEDVVLVGIDSINIDDAETSQERPGDSPGHLEALPVDA
jgi:hypothetical protein